MQEGYPNHAIQIEGATKGGWRRSFGQARDTRKSELKGASRSMYESMSEEQLEEFAHTKRKGKPEHAH